MASLPRRAVHMTLDVVRESHRWHCWTPAGSTARIGAQRDCGAPVLPSISNVVYLNLTIRSRLGICRVDDEENRIDFREIRRRGARGTNGPKVGECDIDRTRRGIQIDGSTP